MPFGKTLKLGATDLGVPMRVVAIFKAILMVVDRTDVWEFF